MNTENRIYHDLQKYLDRMPSGFPEVESGLHIKLLKYLFAPLDEMILDLHAAITE